MTQQPNVSAVGALVGDPARSATLLSLLDGRALPAGELAYASGVTGWHTLFPGIAETAPAAR